MPWPMSLLALLNGNLKNKIGIINKIKAGCCIFQPALYFKNIPEFGENMERTLLVDAINATEAQDEIIVCGWIRTRRDGKDFSFIEINDGSCLSNLQCIIDADTPAYKALGDANTGSALQIGGQLVASPGKGQKWEVRAKDIKIYGLADSETFPLQKKRHSDEFLRTIAHLRPRTNKYGAAFRIRSEAAHAIHEFFRKRHFALIQTPILTGSDCEGAGEMFHVSAGNKGEDNFFNKPASLTVSGQLEAEALALGLGRVYSFGPTFRAENSNTTRHAAEFWMVEPEFAFGDIWDLMELGESLVKHVIGHILENCHEDIELFNKFVDKDLRKRLEGILESSFERISYREAVKILQESGQKFNFPVEFGVDLQTEHERFLTENYFKKPVIVHDYPKDIKAFYMRANDDGETVAAMDILVPGIGELIGGSQREERLDLLTARIRELGQNPDDYWWYLELRKFGSVPHSGFGLGFERLMMMLTGIGNIRDVIPFPRTPGSLEF